MRWRLKYFHQYIFKYMYLEILRRFKGHQVGEELQQEHERLLTVGMMAAASAETHLKQANPKTTGFLSWKQPSCKVSWTLQLSLKCFWSQLKHETLNSSTANKNNKKKINMQPWTSHCKRERWRVPPVHPVEPIGRLLSCSPGRSPQTQRSGGGTADLSETDVFDVKEKPFVVWCGKLQHSF